MGICHWISDTYCTSELVSLPWRHNRRDGVSNHQPYDCLLNRSFRRKSKKTSKLRVTDLCAGNLPVTGEFPAKMASNAENVSIWWRHHVLNIDSWIPFEELAQGSESSGTCISETCDQFPNFEKHLSILWATLSRSCQFQASIYTTIRV